MWTISRTTPEECEWPFGLPFPFRICLPCVCVCVVCGLCLGGGWASRKHYKTICCLDTNMPGPPFPLLPLFPFASAVSRSWPHLNPFGPYTHPHTPTRSAIVCSLRDRISLCFRFVCGCHWYLFICVNVSVGAWCLPGVYFLFGDWST